MEWKQIDKNNLPKGEVLAGNFNPGTEGYKSKLIGYLYLNGAGNVSCDADDTLLGNCSHYVDINNYDPEL
jgi:hypothetical protein